MKRLMARMSAMALAAGLLVFSMAFGQETANDDRQKVNDNYAAVWAVTGGAGGGSTVSIDIHIDRYNTNEDIKRYAELLKSGPDSLRRVLEKEDVGQVSPVGRVGTPLAVARRLKHGDKTIIRVLTTRNLSFAELRNSGRSVDYPYTMLELILDKNGKGTGSAIGAARLRFDKKKNTYEIESFQHGAAYNKLLNVRRMK